MRKRYSENIREMLSIINKNNGIIRSRDALKKGIQPRTLYKMRDSGLIEQVARGVYQLTGQTQTTDLDYGTIALKVPTGVVCLLTALYYHGLTTHIPRIIDIAIDRDTKPPQIAYPPVRFFRFSKKAHMIGVTTIDIGGTKTRIYDKEKTLIDCFRYRKQIGIDIFIEAMKTYRSNKQTNVTKLVEYAHKLRTGKTIELYIEAII